MLFKPEHKEMILLGNKTSTRRDWKRPMVKVGNVYKAKLKMLSKDYFAEIKVLKIYRQKLGDMTQDDCQKEGYFYIVDFKRVWIAINGFWNPEKEIYVIEFEVLK